MKSILLSVNLALLNIAGYAASPGIETIIYNT